MRPRSQGSLAEAVSSSVRHQDKRSRARARARCSAWTCRDYLKKAGRVGGPEQGQVRPRRYYGTPHGLASSPCQGRGHTTLQQHCNSHTEGIPREASCEVISSQVPRTFCVQGASLSPWFADKVWVAMICFHDGGEPSLNDESFYLTRAAAEWCAFGNGRGVATINYPKRRLQQRPQ